MQEHQYRAAIIGCGDIGCGFERYNLGFISTHSKAYMSNDDIELVASHDIEMSKAALKGVPAYASVDELMGTKPNIVSICTPDDTHYPILKQVAEHDCVKGIWCEKPMALSIAQGKEMIELCKSRGIKLLVNHIRRYDEFYITLKEQLTELIGDIQYIVCYYSGGIVTTGSHLLDLLHMLLGECRKVSADKEYECRLIYQNSVKVFLLPVTDVVAMELNIFGTKGRLDTVNKPFGRYLYRYFPVKSDSKLKAKYIAEQADIGLGGIKRDFFQRALADMISSISQDQDPISSGQVALKSLELVSALSYSAATDKSVDLPFDKLDHNIPKPGGDAIKWKSQQS